MDINAILSNVLNWIFSILLIGALSFLVAYLKQLSENSKHKAIYDIVIQAVEATNQTYVEALKAEGLFGADAQKNALDKTMKTIKSLMNNTLKSYIDKLTDGCMDEYLETQIESYISSTKSLNHKRLKAHFED